MVQNMFETQPEGLVPDVQQDPVQQLDAEMAAQEPESATNTDAVNPANAEAEAAKQGEEGKGDEESSDDEEEEEESEEDSEDDGVPRFMQRESVLKFESQLAEFSNANIVRHYMFLLEDYRTNSAALNAYLLRFLERIAVDLKLPATFYQLKFFVTFDTILNDASIRTDAAFVKLRTFAKMIARQYFDALSKNSLMVVHALFKHSRHDLEDLQNPVLVSPIFHLLFAKVSHVLLCRRVLELPPLPPKQQSVKRASRSRNTASCKRPCSVRPTCRWRTNWRASIPLTTFRAMSSTMTSTTKRRQIWVPPV
jgi:hypothetical protein